jgi:hypothetical protein
VTFCVWFLLLTILPYFILIMHTIRNSILVVSTKHLVFWLMNSLISLPPGSPDISFIFTFYIDFNQGSLIATLPWKIWRS